MLDVAEKVTRYRLFRNAAMVAVVVPAALLGACAQQQPPPPQPVVAPAPEPAPAPPPAPAPEVHGERG